MRRYNKWVGHPEGMKEDVTKCIVEVHDTGKSILWHQCQRKRGYGPEGLYCKQHANMLGKDILLYVPRDEK